MTPARVVEGSDHGGREARWARVAFALSGLSTLVYFASSQGIRNFVAFLVEGIVKFARLFGLSA